MPFNSIFFGIACSTLIRMPIIIKLTICTHICNLRVKWNNLRSGVFDLRQWYALAISEPFRWKFGWQNDKNETKFTEIAVCCGKCGVCMVLLRRKSEKKEKKLLNMTLREVCRWLRWEPYTHNSLLRYVEMRHSISKLKAFPSHKKKKHLANYSIYVGSVNCYAIRRIYWFRFSVNCLFRVIVIK